jgi:glycosyltransferase involved in cell wall biosynthesis
MARKILVAIIEPVGGHAGMDYYDFGLCRGLLAAGCGVSLYTCDETVEPEIIGLRFCPTYKRIYGPGNRWIRACRYFSGSVAAIAKAVANGEKVCHLHLFHGELQELALVVFSKLCGRKLIITVHDVESFSPVAISRKVIARIYRLADRFVVHNQVCKRELVEKLGVVPARIEVVPSGNYMNEAREGSNPVQARRELGVTERNRVVLFFGQIKEVKGLDILIEAIPEVARYIPEVTLLIAGRPWRDDFSSYERLIDNLGIRDRCVLHIRYIPNEELGLYFAAADVVVLPYRRIYQSAVILMAMSYGRPVVVSDLPGMTEMVTDGQNGYVFVQESKDALSEQLIRVLQDEQGREAVAARAAEYVRQNNSWEQIGIQTTMLYRAVLSNKSPRSPHFD